jgi:hypothetical protein
MLSSTTVNHQFPPSSQLLCQPAIQESNECLMASSVKISPPESSNSPTVLTNTQNVGLESALADQQNVLHRLTLDQKRTDFLVHLCNQKTEIEATVSHHLNLTTTGACRLATCDEWIHGSFNICLPVYVKYQRRHSESRVIIRFPLPYKIGDEVFPGNADEKLRCEAAAYIWIHDNCPDVPIPRLLGFAFAGNQCVSQMNPSFREPLLTTDFPQFTAPGSIPWYTRLKEYNVRHLRSLFGHVPRCRYIRQRKPADLTPGYLLIEYVEENVGVMLSESWEENWRNKSRRANFFKDLSKIMLSLGRIPLPRIGSFTIDDEGVLSLTNRPLALPLQMLENQEVPTNIGRNTTYSNVEPYLLDLLGYHDSRLRHQPNSIEDRLDCRSQMAVITAMRAILPLFTNRNLRNGPFLFTLTDIHQSNILVDKEWHIKCLIDLEWACVLPIEMQEHPYWLTNRRVDQLTEDNLATYNTVREEFMEAFEKEERQQYGLTLENDDLLHTSTMRKTWETRGYFYFQALWSTTGLFNLFLQHISCSFPASETAELAFDEGVSRFWGFDMGEVIDIKEKDLERYRTSLRAFYEKNVPNSSTINK